MKAFHLHLRCENAAFDDDAALEIVRILRVAADQIEQIGVNTINAGARLRDCNGNSVGAWKYEK